MDWVAISRSAGLTGKEEARSLFKEAIEYLVRNINVN
jgi:hypothetical protein